MPVTQNAVATEVARVLNSERFDAGFPREIAAAFVNQEKAESRPRLLIDVTHIRENDLAYGGATRCARVHTGGLHASRSRVCAAELRLYRRRACHRR